MRYPTSAGCLPKAHSPAALRDLPQNVREAVCGSVQTARRFLLPPRCPRSAAGGEWRGVPASKRQEITQRQTRPAILCYGKALIQTCRRKPVGPATEDVPRFPSRFSRINTCLVHLREQAVSIIGKYPIAYYLIASKRIDSHFPNKSLKDFVRDTIEPRIKKYFRKQLNSSKNAPI